MGDPDFEPNDDGRWRDRMIGALAGACGATVLTVTAGVAIIDTPEPCADITPPIPIEIVVPMPVCETPIEADPPCPACPLAVIDLRSCAAMGCEMYMYPHDFTGATRNHPLGWGVNYQGDTPCRH